MPDTWAPSLQEESLPEENALNTESQKTASLTEITRWQKANVRILLTKTKTTHHHQNSALPPRPVLGTPTPEKLDPDVKAYLLMMVEDIKKDFNNSLKEIEESTAKELQVLKEKEENTS